MLKPILFTLKNIWQSSHRWTIIQVFLLIVLAVLPLYSYVLIKNIIDNLSQKGISDFSLFTNSLILLGVTLILNNIAQNMSTFVGEIQEQLIQNHFSSIIQAHSIQLDMSYYDNPDYHHSMHRAQAEAAYRPMLILQSILGLMQSSLTVLSVGILLFYQHWAIVLVLLLTAIPAVFVKIRYSKKLYEVQNKSTSLDIKSWYLGWVLTKASYAKEVRLFDFGDILKARYKELRTQLFKAKYHVHWHKAISSTIVNSIETIAFVLAFAYTIYLAFIGLISIGALVMYYQVFQKGQSALQQFLQSLVQLYHNQLFIKNIYEFVHLKSHMERATPFAAPPQLIAEISFENVDFSYPVTTNLVLNNINLNIKKGQVVALVGENGSGKTTFVKLLCRLYDVVSGRICVNGTNIKQFDIGDWRQRITVIFQDFMKYEFTANENVHISNIHQDIDKAAIVNAAEKTTADVFIKELPLGFDSKLGKEFENGAELSGGQWQKVALARAFYKNADIIILDEPTSAIDPIAEYDIFMQFKEMARDKILILITHRLYNLKMADNIFVFNNGQIIETGKHETLIQQKGKYFQMFEKQLT
jgi:ATP-binding cassette, subfamily B, bacterial